MQVQVKSSNGITVVPGDTRLLADRKLFIEGEINAETALEFMKKVMLLTKESDTLPIDVFINSPGGSINSGLLMFDIIRTSKAPIRTYCIGAAYSMGAILFSGGTHGRYMLPDSELMIHEPLLGNKISGNASSIRSVSESLMETRRKLNGLLAEITGKTEEEIEQATGFDHYFTAQEALEFGLADEIIHFDQIMEG